MVVYLPWERSAASSILIYKNLKKMPIVYQNIRIKIKKAMNRFKNKKPRKIKLIKRLLKNKKTIVKVDFKISTSVIVNVLKGLGYNFDGFLMAILLWAIVFFILRLPWQFLIKKKHGLIYCTSIC